MRIARDERRPGLDRFTEAVRDLVRQVDWRAAGASLSGVHLSFLDQLVPLTLSISDIDPDAFARLASGIDFAALDAAAAGHWQDFNMLLEPVVALSFTEDREPARSWLMSHKNEIENLPTRVIPIAPEVVVTVLGKGLRVQLDPSDGLRWGECADALAAIRGVSLEAAAAVARASLAGIAAGLALRQSNMVGHLDALIEELDAVDPAIADACIDGVNIDAARRYWRERLAGSQDERLAVLLVLRRAAGRPGEIGEVAGVLLAQG